MKSTLTVTPNPAVDVYGTVQRLVPGDKLRCSDVRRDPGGGGLNVARATRKLGGEAVAVYLSGGPTGQELEQLLASEGVPAHRIDSGVTTRESLVVAEASSGREYRFVLPGEELREPEWQACLDFVAEFQPAPDYIVGSGSLPQGCPDDFYGRLARIARRRGARMVLDTSGAALTLALEERVFLIKPNRREFVELTGEQPVDEAGWERAGRMLRERCGCELVALSLGEEGALLIHGEGVQRERPPAVDVCSDVGAGDSFVAGLVLGLVQEWSVADAFCFGVAAGTAALATPGTELCRRQDAERLHREMCAGAVA